MELDIDAIMGKFDFEEVHKIMKFTNHQWRQDGVPSLEKLKSTAISLLHTVVSNDVQTASTGGLHAMKIKYSENHIELSLNYVPVFSRRQL